MFGIRQQPRSGFVRSWKVDDIVCRALISEHGEVISSVDCWKLPQDHPSLSSNDSTVNILGETHTPYVMSFDLKKEIRQKSVHSTAMKRFTL